MNNLSVDLRMQACTYYNYDVIHFRTKVSAASLTSLLYNIATYPAPQVVGALI